MKYWIYKLLQQVIQTIEQQAYVCKLLGFQFLIEHKSVVSNKVVDALSHVPSEWAANSKLVSTLFQALWSQNTFSIMQQL